MYGCGHKCWISYNNPHAAVYKSISHCIWKTCFELFMFMRNHYFVHPIITRMPISVEFNCCELFNTTRPKLSVQLNHRYERVCRDKSWRMTGQDNEISRVVGVSRAHNLVNYPIRPPSTISTIINIHLNDHCALLPFSSGSDILIWAHYRLLFCGVNQTKGPQNHFELFSDR